VAQEQGLVVPQEDAFFLMFLRAGLMDPAQGLQVMKNYFHLRKRKPEYFMGTSDMERIVREVYSQQLHCMLPDRDQKGRKIYVFRPGRWDPYKIPLRDLFCAGYMLCEMVVREEETQVAGIVSITDAEGFGFKHLRAVGMEDGKNMASFFNICFPLWLRQTHVVHAPRLFHVLFNMLKSFLSADVLENIIIHSDMSTIREHISPAILPSDAGGDGTLGNLDNSDNVAEVRKMSNFFAERRKFGFRE